MHPSQDTKTGLKTTLPKPDIGHVAPTSAGMQPYSS